MTPEQLNYLIVLQEEKNLSRAAERLFITQPTLTAYINRLERKLGVHLFDRQHSPVQITPYGKRYIEKMKELVYAEVHLCDSLRKMQSQNNHIVIGIGYAHSVTQCPRLAEILLERHPDLDISFSEGQERNLLQQLIKGDIDLFLGHAEMEASGLCYGVVQKEVSLLLVPEAYLQDTEFSGVRGTEKKPVEIHPSVLQNRPVILPGYDQGSYITMMSIFTTNRITPSRVISTQNMFTGAKMAARGLGFCYGNKSLVDFLQPSERKRLVYCCLPYMVRKRNFYYSYHEGHPNEELLLEIVEIIRSL